MAQIELDADEKRAFDFLNGPSLRSKAELQKATSWSSWKTTKVLRSLQKKNLVSEGKVRDETLIVPTPSASTWKQSATKNQNTGKWLGNI